MAKQRNAGVSAKYSQIAKANSTVTIAVGVASFFVIFSLFASYSLLSQRSFHIRVIKEKEAAVRQLEANKAAVDELTQSYNDFVNRDPNIIGGQKDGKKDKDGDNAKIILDALPSKYDYPALISSIEKILQDNKFKIVNIEGLDEGESQEEVEVYDLVEMPFEVTTEANFEGISKLLKEFEKSIRPIDADVVKLFSKDGRIEMTYEGNSFYLPESGLRVDTKAIK